MFGRKKPSETDLLRDEINKRMDELSKQTDTRLNTIEQQIEATAARTSEFSQKLEDRTVEFRTQTSKEFKEALDEVRVSLETLSLELNNQILDVSGRLEKISQNAANWSFAVNEQIEEFRKMYADVLDGLKTAKDLAIEKERILTEKYEALVTQLKEKESISLEKETLTQKRLSTLQEEITRREKELEETRSKLIQLESELKEKAEAEEKANKLELEVKRLSDEVEMQKYELERSHTQVKTMSEDAKQTWGSTKALKTFLGESEAGRILSHLLSMGTSSIDELATLTGIATYNVQQIVNRFQDMGIVSIEKGTRHVRLNE